MSVEFCRRCDSLIDTDFEVERIVYITNKDGETDSICIDCLTPKEKEKYQS